MRVVSVSSRFTSLDVHPRVFDRVGTRFHEVGPLELAGGDVDAEIESAIAGLAKDA